MSIIYFINDDTIIFEIDQDNILQYNLFAYCLNNPVNMADYEGHAAANIVGGVIGGLAGAALGKVLADYLGLKGFKRIAFILFLYLNRKNKHHAL